MSGTSLISAMLSSDAKNCNEREQASVLVRTLAAAKSVPQIKNFTVYNLHAKGTNPSDAQHGYGIVDWNYNAKPAYLAIAYMNKQLIGAEFIDKFSFPNDDYPNDAEGIAASRAFSGYHFGKSGDDFDEETFVLWKHTGKEAKVKVERSAEDTVSWSESEGQNSVSINVPQDYEFKRVDMYGNDIGAELNTEYALGAEPQYIICRKQKKTITVESYANGLIAVSGKAKSPNSEVTLFAVDANYPGENKFIAMAQQKSDDNAWFEFKLKIENSLNQNCMIYVFDGAVTENIYTLKNESDYAVSAEYYINGVQTEDISAVNDGDVVKARFTLKDAQSKRENLLFYAALYGSGGRLMEVDCNSAEWDVNGTAVFETIISMGDTAETDKLVYYLWNEALQPIAKPIIIKY